MDGQSSVYLAIFVKALIVAAGAATGVLGILIALSFGVALMSLLRMAVRRVKGVFKREPKSEQTTPAPMKQPNYV